jgi:hypothetical protein
LTHIHHLLIVDHVEIHALYDQFKTLSTVDTSEGGIDQTIFDQCLGPLGVEKNLITERIFAFFDQDSDGLINFSELVCGLSILCKGSLEEKIQCKLIGSKNMSKLRQKFLNRFTIFFIIYKRLIIFDISVFLFYTFL